MDTKMEIVAQFELHEPIDDKMLRQHLKIKGIDARRLSRFTQLALFGALELQSYLSEDSCIYLGSSFNSPSKFFKMFNGLMMENVPSPLDFAANISNATVFQLAKTLKLQGTSLFLALEKLQLPQLVQLAQLDVQPNQTALIGWVLEDINDIANDESQWWVIRGK